MLNRTQKPKPARSRVTLKDVADQVGVSINTVSAVLNERRSQTRVSTATRNQIEDVARQLGYRRNTAASLLAGGRTKTLGILLDSLSNVFAASIAESFEQEAARRGYQCFIGCTQHERSRRVEYVEQMLSHNVEGLVLIGVLLDPDTQKALNLAISSNTIVVTADLAWPGHDAPVIRGNHFQGGQKMASHLLEVGHRDYLYLVPPEIMLVESIQDRIRGMQSVLDASGLAGLSFEGVETPARGIESVKEVLLPIMNSSRPPSVIAVGHDLHAFLAISALASGGFEVPRDVAVVGYDDIQWEFLSVMGTEAWDVLPLPIRITTVRQPIRGIGRESARVLIDRIESLGGEEETEGAGSFQLVLDVELIVRDTCRLPERLK